jgi:hypothetical protein
MMLISLDIDLAAAVRMEDLTSAMGYLLMVER